MIKLLYSIFQTFTPNRDLINDVFMPYVDGVSKYDFYIYSRQGQKIFHTQNTEEGWDGYIKMEMNMQYLGNMLHYIYIVDLHGKERVYQGNFLLIR